MLTWSFNVAKNATKVKNNLQIQNKSINFAAQTDISPLED